MGRALLIAALMGVAGFWAGLSIGRSSETHSMGDGPPPTTAQVTAERPHGISAHAPDLTWRRSGSDLVRPLLGCRPAAEGGLEGMRQQVVAVLDAARARRAISHAGVFVYDLTTDRALGVDADALFVPASVAKVPLLMALLRMGESDHEILTRPVFYPEWMRDNERQNIRPGAQVTPGRTWTMGQLAEAMIVESDNNATRLLREELEQPLVERVYLDLGWEEQETYVAGRAERTTSPRVVGRTFQVLYNATYLGDGTSDLALRLLSRVTMRDGIVAGVPPGVTVAHKFGEWSHSTEDGSIVGQFHDCGIVYRPDRPYVLCVMTRGETYFQRPLIEVVAEISRAVWSGFEGLSSAR